MSTAPGAGLVRFEQYERRGRTDVTPRSPRITLRQRAIRAKPSSFGEAPMKTRFAVAFFLCASLLGCGPRSGLLRPRESVQLTVQNNRFEDATIHALWKGGAKRRVGVVTGKTSETFSFERVSDEVQFLVDFVAAEDYTVETIDVQRGDHLDLVILGAR